MGDRERVIIPCLKGKSLFRLLHKVGHPAEDRGSCRAELAAGRELPLLVSVIAELAFPDSRERLVIFEFWDVERTSHLTIPAAYAGVLVIEYDPVYRIFLQGRHRTRRNTGGINAVHAVPFDKGNPVGSAVLVHSASFLVHLYYIQRLRGKVDRIVPERLGGRMLRGHLIFLLACQLADLAPYADGGIIQDADSLRRQFFGLPGKGRLTRGKQQTASCGYLQKISSFDIHGLFL